MYTGQVSVKQELLDEFFQTADALKIKGLTTDYPMQTNTDDQELLTNSTLNEPKHVGTQYQTSQINQTHSPAMLCHRTDDSPVSGLSFFDQNILDDIKENVFDSDISNNSYDFGTYELFSANVDNNAQWNSDDIIEETTSGVPNEPIAKHPRANNYGSDSDYNSFADVRSIEGHEYLIHNNYKFGRHGHMRELEQKQRWRCTRNRTSKCRAAVSTISVKLIDSMGDQQVEKDVYMLKVLNGDHSHDHET